MTVTPQLVLVLIWGAVILGFALRIGPVGRKEHARDPHGSRLVTFWNILDEKKWTEEGLAHHRRSLRFMALVLLSLIPFAVILRVLEP